MPQNPELELALQFIQNTDRNLFLTGKAGTGKTTFLHQIKNESLKRMVIVAPTGVAAINAKGVTIHSFFQMPFGPILPNQSLTSNNPQRKFSKTKIDIIRSLDLVVIDEISMVRADLLDGIDQVLRRYKDRNKVFGGAQMLFIGDLQQLAPVVKPNEWNLLRNHYETMYFFSSKSFQEAQMVSIELKHIYRQENPEFISILNEIRNDTLSATSAEILNKRYNPTFVPKENDGYITLTTHNRRAQSINNSALQELDKHPYYFDATINGKFSESAYPNHERLELKVGAQVMFIKNDSSPEKRYFNGKIGKIIFIEDDVVAVKCPNDDYHIETSFETWENINYSLDEETKEIKEDLAGSFAQIPLRLAWAITIHKSQGLTFEKAIIDAEASFAHGQTYVALSRCTSLEGIVLKSKITSNAIINDATIDVFNQNVAENHPDEDVLLASEKQYQLNLISELFDFNSFLYPINRLIDIFYKNQTSLKGEIIEHLVTIKDNGIVNLLKVANGFKNQLKQIDEGVLAENSSTIQERFKKAVHYFNEETKANIQKEIDAISFSTDNKTVKKDLEKQFEKLQELTSIKLFCFDKLKDGFKTQSYLQIRANAVLQDVSPKKKKKSVKKDPLLAIQLRDLRTSIYEAENIPAFQVFTQETLYELCEVLPRNSKELLKVKGMGKIRVAKYGEEILEVIEKHCVENGINHQNKQKREDKKPTKEITFELFKKGLSVKEIAKERSLTSGTIESHLASFISSGEINILDLISKEKYKKLQKTIEETEFKNLTELKEKASNTFSYMDLRMALLAVEFEKSSL